jgi:hypothetical protein
MKLYVYLLIHFIEKILFLLSQFAARIFQPEVQSVHRLRYPVSLTVYEGITTQSG